MKTKNNSFRKFTSRSFFLILAAALVLLSPVLQAQSYPSESDPMQIQYIGLYNGKPLFKVGFENNDRKAFEFSISDDEGTLFYSDKFSTIYYTRSFLIDLPTEDPLNLVISIREKHKKTIKYIITRENIMVPKISIARL